MGADKDSQVQCLAIFISHIEYEWRGNAHVNTPNGGWGEDYWGHLMVMLRYTSE